MVQKQLEPCCHTLGGNLDKVIIRKEDYICELRKPKHGPWNFPHKKC